MKELASRKKEIFVGLAVLTLIVIAFFVFKGRTKKMTVSDTKTEPTITQIEQNLKTKYNIIVPDNVEKTDLKDVSGGNGSALATRNEILADLPDPDAGYFYQAWLGNGSNNVSLGKMTMEKGGYLISYDSSKYPGYNKVIVSLEKVFDYKEEKRILEGSF